MNNVGEVLGRLAAKQFDALIGVSEGVWLDAKERPYLLDNLKQKLELAKDVSAMANSVGGIIVLGFDTERDVLTVGERINEVKPFPLAMTDSDHYRKVIREHVYPPPDVEVSVYEAEGEKGVAGIFQRSTPFPKSIFENIAYGLPSAIITRRTDRVVRCGFISRSRKSASCFRRKRFSAIRAVREPRSKRKSVSNSAFYSKLNGSTEFLRSTSAEESRTVRRKTVGIADSVSVY